jgi:hypothetical protein
MGVVGHRCNLYASDFRAADLQAGRRTRRTRCSSVRPMPVVMPADLARLTGALKPSVVTADDLARIGTRVPEFFTGDLFCPVGGRQSVSASPWLLIFEQFDAFDQARLKPRRRLREIRRGNRRRRHARLWRLPLYPRGRAAPEAPCLFTGPRQPVSPGKFQNAERPIWTPLAIEQDLPMPKPPPMASRSRGTCGARSSLLMLDREFETQSVDPCFRAGKRTRLVRCGRQRPRARARCAVALRGR